MARRCFQDTVKATFCTFIGASETPLYIYTNLWRIFIYDQHVINNQLSQVHNLIDLIKGKLEILGDSQSMETLEAIREQLHNVRPGNGQTEI